MPRCADFTCGRWRPERMAPRWAAGIRFNNHWYCSRECVENAARIGAHHAERDAHQGSLASPIFAEQCVHCPSANDKLSPIEGWHCAKSFADVDQGNRPRSLCRSCVSHALLALL